MLEYRLPTGVLEVRVDKATWPFHTLIGIAARNNPRRGFAFVGKLLGKHYPADPVQMSRMHLGLAQQLGGLSLPEPITFIGMAETATGLSHGCYEHFKRLKPESLALYLHSTRYFVGDQERLSFCEPHSHGHQLVAHLPEGGVLSSRFHDSATLVLIDDEITTGTTLLNLLRICHAQQPRLRKVVVVSPLNVMDVDMRREWAVPGGLDYEFVSLIDAILRFEINPSWEPQALGGMSAACGSVECALSAAHGRLGLADAEGGLYAGEISDALYPHLQRSLPVLVVGTGEFIYPPYRLALSLARKGFKVSCQSTTRSPLMIAGDIQHRMEFPSIYSLDHPEYLYNVRPEQYPQVIIGCETGPTPALARLCQQLNAFLVHYTDDAFHISGPG